MVLAIGVSLISSIVVLYGFPSTTSSEDPQLDHESFAAPYPADIEKYYKVKASDPYLTIHENWIDTEMSCEFCTRIEYNPGVGKGELTFSSDKIHNFKTAKQLSFFIMGEEGEEKVKFKVAGKKNAKFSGRIDYKLSSEPLTLTPQWRKMELDLSKTDLTGVTNPLTIQTQNVDGKGPMVFYIKAIRYDTKMAEDPVSLTNSDVQ